MHVPSGVCVATQRFRSLASNRLEARRLLAVRIDNLENGEESVSARRIAREQKRKRKTQRRAREKYFSDT